MKLVVERTEDGNYVVTGENISVLDMLRCARATLVAAVQQAAEDTGMAPALALQTLPPMVKLAGQGLTLAIQQIEEVEQELNN